MKKEDFAGAGKYNPFVREKSEQVLREVVRSLKPKEVLEIGTYLGYSASVMADEGAGHITTLERDEKIFEFAKINLQKFENITSICVDAADFLKTATGTYDLIFLDGAKAQYHNYFPYLKRLLNVGGVLVCDDVLFYGLVQGDGAVKHKHRTIVERLRLFLTELQNDTDFETTLFEFEDGLTVSKKIK